MRYSELPSLRNDPAQTHRRSRTSSVLLCLALAGLVVSCGDRPDVMGPGDRPAPEGPLSPGGATGTVAGSTRTTIVSGLAPDKCIEIRDGQAVLASCNGSAAQIFEWWPSGEIRWETLCLGPTAAALPGDPLTTGLCRGTANQSWTMTAAKEIRIGGDKCIDIDGAKTLNGTPIIIWGCHGGRNQSWIAQTRASLPTEPQIPGGSTTTSGLPYGSDSPVIYVNDDVVDMYTDEYLMALASTGEISLRGIITQSSIAPYNSGLSAAALVQFVSQRAQGVQHARNSGLRNIPNPIAAGAGHLTRPSSGRIEDTSSLGGAAAQLIVDEARRASPDRPLVVVVGGPLTIPASAYLLDPSIADRVVVAWLGGTASHMGDYNGWADAWAAYVVLERLRLVFFTPGSADPTVQKSRLDQLPATPLREWMKAKQHPTNSLPGSRDADAAPAISLMRPEFATAVKPVRFAGWITTDGHQVPTFREDPAGRALMVTGSSAIATEEWWRALMNPAVYSGSGSTGGGAEEPIGPVDSGSSAVPAGSVFELRSQHAPGKCLEFRNNVGLLYGCNGSAGQKLTAGAAGDIRFGSLCLTTQTPVGLAGERIIAGACTGGAHQRWQFTDLAEVVGVGARCFDLHGQGKVDGTAVLYWDCHRGSNQRWTPQIAGPVAPPTEPTTPPVDSVPSPSAVSGEVMLLSQHVANKCLTLLQGFAVLGTCVGGPEQVLTRAENGELRLGALCLTSQNAVGLNGDRIRTAFCTGAPNQRWSHGELDAIRGSSGRCMDLYAGGKTDGTSVILWDCHGRTNQRWSVDDLDAGPGGPPTEPTTPPVDSVPSDSVPAEPSVPEESVGDPREVVFRSGLPGTLCLELRGGAAVLGACGRAGQVFTWLENGALQRGDSCLRAMNPTGLKGDRIVAGPCTGAANQVWTATASAELKGVGGRCIDVDGQRAIDGVFTVLWDCHGGPNQRWHADFRADPGTEPSGGQTEGTGSAEYTRRGFYVSPAGTPSGNGTPARPWDLRTALGHPSAVQPGDTIWLTEGRYVGDFTSRLSGTSSSPIVVRRYPGDRATIDGSIAEQGRNVWHWGYEIMNSMSSNRHGSAPGGMNWYGNHGAIGIKAINMVIHNTGHPGIGVWTTGLGTEIYGTLIWGVGRYAQASESNYIEGQTLGSGVYAQNDGTTLLEDNIAFRNFTIGLKAYGKAGGVNGFHLVGNTVFDNGLFQILGSGDGPVSDFKLLDNMSYLTPGHRGYGVWAGYEASDKRDVEIRGNYFGGGNAHGNLKILRFSDVIVEDNVFVAQSGGKFPGGGSFVWWEPGASGSVRFENNRYHSINTEASPFIRLVRNGQGQGDRYTFQQWVSTTRLDASSSYSSGRPANTIIMRPNRYEQGRANITVYNWQGQSQVSVNISGAGLRPGDRFEIRDAQDFFGSPVVSGTYAGGSVSIPMGGGSVAPLLGTIEHFVNAHTPSEFGVFVLVKAES